MTANELYIMGESYAVLLYYYKWI